MASRPSVSEQNSWRHVLSDEQLALMQLEETTNAQNELTGYRIVYLAAERRQKNREVRIDTPPLHVCTSTIPYAGSVFKPGGDPFKRSCALKTSLEFTSNQEWHDLHPRCAEDNKDYYEGMERFLERIKDLVFETVPAFGQYIGDILAISKYAPSIMINKKIMEPAQIKDFFEKEIVKKPKEATEILRQAKQKFSNDFRSWIFLGDGKYDGDKIPGHTLRYKFAPFMKNHNMAAKPEKLDLNFSKATPVIENDFLIKRSGLNSRTLFQLIKKARMEGMTYRPIHFKVHDNKPTTHLLPDGRIVPWFDDPRIDFIRPGSIVVLESSFFVFIKPGYGIRMSFGNEVGVYQRGPEYVPNQVVLDPEYLSSWTGEDDSIIQTQPSRSKPNHSSVELQKYPAPANRGVHSTASSKPNKYDSHSSISNQAPKTPIKYDNQAPKTLVKTKPKSPSVGSKSVPNLNRSAGKRKIKEEEEEEIDEEEEEEEEEIDEEEEEEEIDEEEEEEIDEEEEEEIDEEEEEEIDEEEEEEIEGEGEVKEEVDSMNSNGHDHEKKRSRLIK